MSDSQLLNEGRREDPGRESATEYLGELGVEPSNSHVLKFKVGSKDSVRGRPEMTQNCVRPLRV